MTLHTTLKNHFEEVYEQLAGSKYYWTPKDAKGLKQLIAKLTFLVEIKRKDFTDQDICEAFELILTCVRDIKELEWYRSNLSISIINSKLNEIIATIRNAKSNRQNRVASDISSHFKRVEEETKP